MDDLGDSLGEGPAIADIRDKVRRLVDRRRAGERLPAFLLQGDTCPVIAHCHLGLARLCRRPEHRSVAATLYRKMVLTALVLALLPALLQGCATKAATAPSTGSTTRGPIADWTGRIPLDSVDPRYRPYLDQVKKKIGDQWTYPCIKMEGRPPSCEYKPAELEVEFGILKDGRVQFVEVMRHSDYAIYDEYAVNAIKGASPFPPVPPEMMAARPGSTGVPIRARFIYIVPTSR